VQVEGSADGVEVLVLENVKSFIIIQGVDDAVFCCQIKNVN